jgi:hypothetical protein
LISLPIFGHDPAPATSVFIDDMADLGEAERAVQPPVRLRLIPDDIQIRKESLMKDPAKIRNYRYLQDLSGDPRPPYFSSKEDMISELYVTFGGRSLEVRR